MILLANYLMWAQLSQVTGAVGARVAHEQHLNILASLVDSGWDRIIERQMMLCVQASSPWVFGAGFTSQLERGELELEQGV